MTYKRPGVYVEETLLQASPADSFPSVAAAAFVGPAYRGPVNIPVKIDSWALFQRYFGGFNGTDQSVAHAVYQYYNNGGSIAYIVRSAGTGAVTATRTLNDRAGSPVPLLTTAAKNPGAWGNLVYVEITDVGITGRFNMNVRLGGVADQFVVERWTDLTLDPTDSRYAPSLVNSPTSGSIYITITNLFAGTWVAAVNTPAASATPGGDVLTTGADGAAPTTGATGQLWTTVGTLSAVDDFITVNVPNVVDTATVNAIITTIESLPAAFLVIDCAPALTPAQAVTAASAYNVSSYAAMYYPRLTVADPSNTIPGATKLIAPGGPVLGVYSTTDALRGTFRSPAGVTARLNGVVALEYKALDSELDALNVGRVNAIRTIPGAGFCVFGARTLKYNQIDRYISARRTLISIRIALINATRFAAFEPNNDDLWLQLREACGRILLELWQDGGLRGNSAEEAFYVKCDSENNPQSAINNGEVRVEVGVALDTPAEFIILRIGQFDSGSTVSEEV